MVLQGKRHDEHIEDQQPKAEGSVGVELELEGPRGQASSRTGGAEVGNWTLSDPHKPLLLFQIKHSGSGLWNEVREG